MEQLPEELVLHIASFLEATNVLPLNLVSKHFFDISRDNELWKSLSLQGSYNLSRSLRHRDGRYGGPATNRESVAFAFYWSADESTTNSRSITDDGIGLIPETRARTVECSLGNNELASPKTVDWYNEYVARHAPLSMSWLAHNGKAQSESDKREIRGMGLFKRDDKNILITPMEDGSVQLYGLPSGVKRSDAQAGQIIARAEPGTLFDPSWTKGTLSHISAGNAMECISIDQVSQRAYIAAHSTLTEVDLSTLQAISRQTFGDQICSLSEGGIHPDPLTVCNTRSVHIYDPRERSSRASISSTNTFAEGHGPGIASGKSVFSDFQRLYTGDASHSESRHPASVEALPLSTVHLLHNIHIGGRFPSILTYDRRQFPRNMTSMYSGARISALALLASTNDTQQSLVAAGEYKGKGSLEIYPLTSEDSPSMSYAQTVKNRTSASRSKLLSVIKHGTRLLFSDLDGQLKWVERNGSTLVRRWNVNNWSIYSSSEARGNIFNAGANEGDVARKLLAVDESERSDVLIWTGERIGILSHGNKPRLGTPEKDSDDGSGEEGTASGDERNYGRMMRRALEKQADEVRFVRGLGLGV